MKLQLHDGYHWRSTTAEVIGPDGQPVGRAWSAESASALVSRILLKARQKVRTCITCGKTFLSWGPGHRMCNLCRERGEPW